LGSNLHDSSWLRTEEWIDASLRPLVTSEPNSGFFIASRRLHSRCEAVDAEGGDGQVALPLSDEVGDDAPPDRGAELEAVGREAEGVVDPRLARARPDHRQTVVDEALESGDPFRRDALKKPVRLLDKYKDYTVV